MAIQSMKEYLDYLEQHFYGRTAFQWVDPDSEEVCRVSMQQYVSDIRKNAAFLNEKLSGAEGKHIALFIKNDYDSEVLVKESEKKICAEIYCEAAKQEDVEKGVRDLNRTLPRYKRINTVVFREKPLKKQAYRRSVDDLRCIII